MKKIIAICLLMILIVTGGCGYVHDEVIPESASARQDDYEPSVPESEQVEPSLSEPEKKPEASGIRGPELAKLNQGEPEHKPEPEGEPEHEAHKPEPEGQTLQESEQAKPSTTEPEQDKLSPMESEQAGQNPPATEEQTPQEPEQNNQSPAVPEYTEPSPSHPEGQKPQMPEQECVHVWDEGRIVIPADCSAAGKMEYRCGSCGQSRTEMVSRTAHDFVTEVTEATCTEDGRSRKYCSVCQVTVAENILPAKGHVMKESWWWQATCTETGYRNFLCSVCGYIDEANSGTVERLPHSIIKSTVQEGNCMSDTVIQYKCTVCLEIVEEERYTESNRHSWTEDEEGIYCEWCGISK